MRILSPVSYIADHEFVLAVLLSWINKYTASNLSR